MNNNTKILFEEKGNFIFESKDGAQINPVAIIKAISGTKLDISLLLYIGITVIDMKNIITGIKQVIAIKELNSVFFLREIIIPTTKIIKVIKTVNLTNAYEIVEGKRERNTPLPGPIRSINVRAPPLNVGADIQVAPPVENV